MDSQTTTDPLAELVDDIERRIGEARREMDFAKEKGAKNCEAVQFGKIAALVKLRDDHDRRMDEAASVEKSSPVVRSGEWVGAQRWTAEYPRASGVWWWWDQDDRHEPEIVEVTAEPWMEMMKMGPTMKWPGLTRVRNVKLVGGLWAGPVKPPKTRDEESAPTDKLCD